MMNLAIPGVLVALLAMSQAACCCNGNCDPDGPEDATFDDGPQVPDLPFCPTGGDSCGETLPDLPTPAPPPLECDVWRQDCGAGRKCVSYDSSDPHAERDSTRCVPVANDAVGPGNGCQLEDAPIDNCDAGSMCLVPGVDPNDGTCAALCTESNRACEGGQACVDLDALTKLCMTSCDPLGSNCPSGTGCYPVGTAPDFVCWPEWSGSSSDGGTEGMPCGIDHGCRTGLACVDAGSLPEGCDAERCCVQMCDVDGDSSNFACPEGDTCTSFVNLPEGNVGICSTPAF